MARKILVVEDSPTQAERVRLLLESSGYEVAVARNGREGLQSVEAAPPDLIIADVVMPEMDGYAFCQAVKTAPRPPRAGGHPFGPGARGR
jgi:CheY-like chemotaxis protein